MIALGLFTKEESVRAAKRLVDVIGWSNNKMHVGILGARHIFHVLSEYGYGDLAYKMIVGDDFPSYGDWVKKGSTALWETFLQTEDGEELKTVSGRPLASLNHHFFGDISQWFMKYIVGINVNERMEDCNVITVRPCKIKDMQKANGVYSRNGKKIEVDWIKEKDVITLKVINDGFKVDFDFDGYEVKNKNCNEKTLTFQLFACKSE